MWGINDFEDSLIEYADDDEFTVNVDSFVKTLDPDGWEYPLVHNSVSVFTVQDYDAFNTTPGPDPETDGIETTKYMRIRCKDDTGKWTVWSSTLVVKISSATWNNDPIIENNVPISYRHFEHNKKHIINIFFMYLFIVITFPNACNIL